jgi:hypothetical protein
MLGKHFYQSRAPRLDRLRIDTQTEDRQFCKADFEAHR